MYYYPLLGAIVGDVVGSTRERHNIKREQFELLPPGSHPTDDTVMSLAVAEWLLNDPQHQEQTLVDCMQRWGRRYPRAGYGHKFRYWLTADNPQPYGSYGNGSAMRVSPVGLYADSLEECLALAETTARVSHNHPEGIKGAQSVAACVYLHRMGASRKEIQDYVERTFGYNLQLDLAALRPYYRFDSSCQGSVPVAIACFLQREEPEEALRLAISMGGDSDTIAAITCSIAYARWGCSDQLCDEVEKLLTSDLKALNDRFFEMLSQRQEARVRDSIRGSLIGGACGDALGYEVEFASLNTIEDLYGPQGITRFALHNGKALVSDDTQMTLFTATGLLFGITRGHLTGLCCSPENYVVESYIDWYYTQYPSLQKHHPGQSWLVNCPELFHRRAPGNTCLSAIRSMIEGHSPDNNSKGCGGIMRVAPMGLMMAAYQARLQPGYTEPEYMLTAAGHVAEVTHKHSMGYLPAALLSHLLFLLAPLSPAQAKERFKALLAECFRMLYRAYPQQKESIDELQRQSYYAVSLLEEEINESGAIRRLGEGWTGDEAWYIALYCALRHLDDPEQAIRTAVNHSGDSDSTGSICGNIMGAIYGYEHLRQRNLFCPEGHRLEQTLELHDIILSLADDLSSPCPIGEYVPITTPEQRQWMERYGC